MKNQHRPSPAVFMLLIGFMQFLIVGIAFLGGFLVHRYWYADVGSKAIDLPVLHQAYTLLKDNLVFPLPDASTLEHGMIRGMLTAVNEPFTVFVEPAQHQMQTDRLQGKYGGIGVRIERDAQKNIYLFPLPDSPALKAGIQDGDRLLAIGALGMTPTISDDEIHSAIRGPVGQKIEVTIGHRPAYIPVTVVMDRAEVALPSTTWNLAPSEQRVGVVHIHIIANTTPTEVSKAVVELKQQGADRFIIDVRDNGGGLVEAGVNTARLFLKTGTVIQEQYRKDPVETFRVNTPGDLTDLPVVILVNKGTASAAEIFAGAIKGQKRALVVGTPTYGKDTIQLVFNLVDGSSLHVTSAHWWVPGLEPKIGGNGIQPDIVLSEQADEAEMMQKAIEAVLKTANH